MREVAQVPHRLLVGIDKLLPLRLAQLDALLGAASLPKAELAGRAELAESREGAGRGKGWQLQGLVRPSAWRM